MATPLEVFLKRCYLQKFHSTSVAENEAPCIPQRISKLFHLMEASSSFCVGLHAFRDLCLFCHHTWAPMVASATASQASSSLCPGHSAFLPKVSLQRAGFPFVSEIPPNCPGQLLDAGAFSRALVPLQGSSSQLGVCSRVPVHDLCFLMQITTENA